jgi:hypothetical protein
MSAKGLFTLTSFLLLTGSVSHAGKSALEMRLERLKAEYSVHFSNKYYTDENLYEDNRYAFQKHYKTFKDLFKKTYAPNRQDLEKNKNDAFVLEVEKFNQLLMETKTELREESPVEVEYLFDPRTLIDGFPWSQNTLLQLIQTSEMRTNELDMDMNSLLVRCNHLLHTEGNGFKNLPTNPLGGLMGHSKF